MDKREVIKLLSTYYIINKSVFFCILYDRLTRVAKSAMVSLFRICTSKILFPDAKVLKYISQHHVIRHLSRNVI